MNGRGAMKTGAASAADAATKMLMTAMVLIMLSPKEEAGGELRSVRDELGEADHGLNLSTGLETAEPISV